MLSFESINSCMSRNGKNELMLGYYCLLDEILDFVNVVIKDSVNGFVWDIFKDEFVFLLISLSGDLFKGFKGN